MKTASPVSSLKGFRSVYLKHHTSDNFKKWFDICEKILTGIEANRAIPTPDFSITDSASKL